MTDPPAVGPAGVVVRAAVAADVARIGEVCAEGFAASSRGLLPPEVVAARTAAYYAPGRVEADLVPSSAGWLGYVVAVVDGRVVGAGGGSVTGRTGHLLVLYLDLATRGRGLGTALLEHVTAQQRAGGATRQRVTVTEGNEMGLPFYRRQGFTQVDRHPFGPETGETAWSLVLERPL